MAEITAIIRRPHVGNRGDYDFPVLWFDAEISEGSGALIVLNWDEAKEVLSKVYDVRNLEGMPCWVETDGRIIKFIRLWQK